MIRKTLIIACDGTSSGALQGHGKDAQNVKRYLMSPAGGCWFQSEINTLHNPTKQGVALAISNMRDADYVVTVFSGHGCMSARDGQQYLEVADGDINLGELITYAPRQLILLDSCRTLVLLEKAVSAVEMFSINDSSKYIDCIRAYFDQQVAESEEGLTICYSSDVNQASVDTSEGGAYICSLIDVAKRWYENQPNASISLPINIAHQLACDEIKKYYTKQTPVIRPEKRKRYFPFAVKCGII